MQTASKLQFQRVPALFLAIAILLTACGGSGESPPPAPTIPQTTYSQGTSTGSVTQTFSATPATAAFYQRPSLQSIFPLFSVPTQDANGAISRIGNYSLTGQRVVKEIAGDSNFAMGRWVVGSLNEPGYNTVLSDSNRNNFVHYLIYNPLVRLPISGTLTCDAGTFTNPSFINYSGAPRIGDGVVAFNGSTGIGDVADTATTTGTASVTFTPSGAMVSFNLSASVLPTGRTPSSVGTLVVATTIPTATTVTISGGYLGIAPGAALALGDDGPGRYIVAFGYRLNLANTATYSGVGIFRCQ